MTIAPTPSVSRRITTPIYQTNLGSAFCGDSMKLLESKRFEALSGTVQMVFTSPPFPLNTKKKYGNL